MNIHKNARLTPIRREEMALSVIAGRLSKVQAAREYLVSAKIVSRWTGCFRAEGRAGMQDSSSRPKLIPTQTAEPLAGRIITLRRQRFCGKHIALQTGVSPATVSRVLRRAGLSRMKALTPPEPVVRYEYKEPGGLIHLDIKKLGRFERVGHRITGDRKGPSYARGLAWEYVHIFIDDASRIAVTGIFPDEKAVSAIAALRAAVAYYQSLGITVTRVMTDNGSCLLPFKAMTMLAIQLITLPRRAILIVPERYNSPRRPRHDHPLHPRQYSRPERFSRSED